MAITSGVHNVGPGEALTSWAAAAAQVNGQTFTGDVTFIQTGDLDAVDTTVIWGPISMANRRLRFTSLVPHLGNFGAGYFHRYTSALSLHVSMWYFFGLSPSGTLEIDGLYWISAGTWPATAINYDGSARVILKNVLFRHGASAGPARLFSFGGNYTMDLFNCKGYAPNTAMEGATARSFATAPAALRIENMSMFSAFAPCFSLTNVNTPSADRYIRNCIGYSAANNVPHFELGHVASSYNASGDASAVGVGSFQNIVPADHFMSLDVNNADFLNLKDTSSLRAAGTSPNISGNLLGIRGNPRPGWDALSSIGADEWGPFITSGALFPAATAKPSHVRIMRGHRNPLQAQDFHEVMRVGA